MFSVIEIDKGIIKITPEWERIEKLSVKEQAYELAKKLFSDKIFNKSLHNSVDFLTKEDFLENWKELSNSTLERRKQTIKSWINWFNDVFE
jgi:hypothetical protein